MPLARLNALVLWAGLFCCSAQGAELRLQLKTRTVFIVPMAEGIDRHLASRLTSSAALWVVLDPRKANAVLTDRVDDAFWAWTKAWYGSGPGKAPTDNNHYRFDLPRPKAISGTLFLVDPRSGLVLWATYETVSDRSPGALDQVAEEVAKRLKRSLKGQ